ncbi:MAG: ABC-type transport system substrate-binding protein [Bacteriovoracaceae bacterium]|jgi:oligopeptide transport system substrate-binding protein
MYKLSVSILLAFSVMFTSCTKKKNYEEKVLEINVSAKVKGLDPVNAGDTYSSGEIARVYEGLLQYHYLTRPFKLEPNLAEAMPTVSDDGLTYTFKVKKGVLFHDNKCFPNGKGRELKAKDFVYAISRMADLKNNSTGWWLLDGKIQGLNEWRETYSGKTANYDDKIEGLQALDDYTLQFKLTKKYPQFLYSLAMTYTYAVAREAVETYGEEFLNNPVGTGPFMTGTYSQANVINYVKNPTFRDVRYPTEGSAADKANGLLVNAGQKLPLVDKIKVNIVTEASTRFLKFKNGEVDYSEIPKDDFNQVVTPDQALTDSFEKMGIALEITPDLDITYIAFNHDDPLFKKNNKLKQAMSLAYDHQKANELFYNGRGMLAQTIVPPGIGGYDPDYKNPYAKYDIAAAKKMLAEAGYPEGKGLPEIQYETTSTTVARQMSEFFAKSMKDIGIKIKVNTNTWPQLTQKTKKRQAQMFGMAWLGDYPDAENFLQLLYGPNSAPGPNGGNYNNAKFNAEFEKVKNMQPSPERAKLYGKLAQEVAEATPLLLGVHRTSFVLKHSWLKNYKFSTFSHGNSKYYDIDLSKKKKVLESGILTKTAEEKTASN